MSRFFFHTLDGDSRRDLEGVDLPSLEEAGVEGVRLLGELLADKPLLAQIERPLTVTVTDDAGRSCYIVQASLTVPANRCAEPLPPRAR